MTCPDCEHLTRNHLEDDPGRGMCLESSCLDRPACPSQVRR